MASSQSDLQGVRGFTRGFLLAMDWAGHSPDAKVAARVPGLGGEDMLMLYRAFRALPRESRRAMRTTWAKRDPLRRIDASVDLHPSWMVEALEQEPPTLFLLALGELEPNLARSVLRELWPKMRPKPNAAVDEVRPLSPAQAGAFRRFLYKRWIHLGSRPATGATEPYPTGARGQSPGALTTRSILEPILRLDAGQIWLLAQEFGRREIEQLGGRLDPDHASPRIRAAYANGGDENERTGLVGLHLLSTLLAEHPRQYALHLAQRMAQPVAHPFVRWRDEQAGGPERPRGSGPGDGSAHSGRASGGPNEGPARPVPEKERVPAEDILERARAMNRERPEDEA